MLSGPPYLGGRLRVWQKGGRRGSTGEGEAQRGEITCPRSPNRVAVLTILSGEQD